jgi:hypothetical protein
MAEKCYQQVIDTESYNICLVTTTRSQALFFYDPSDLQINHIQGKPAHLVFHADTMQKANIDNSKSTS